MKCVICDNPKALKKKPITMRYKQCGLENVVLHGVERFRCGHCGEEYINFGDQEQLHALIAGTLISKKGLLNGREVKFLRTYLGYSGAMFAKRVGYTKETLSRYENGKVEISKTFDILLRALVATSLPDRDYDLHDQILGEQRKTFKLIELNVKNDKWHLKQAA